jgi:hypothetical protein
MTSAEFGRRVEKVVGYPPLSEISENQRREFHEALLDADAFEDLPGEVAGSDPRGRAARAEPQTPPKRVATRAWGDGNTASRSAGFSAALGERGGAP